MSKVIVTSMTPGQLFVHCLDQARSASAEIERLKTAPMAPGETMLERALLVAAQAHALSEAFDIIDALAGDEDATTSLQSSSPSSVMQGCVAGKGNPTTN